MFGIGRARLLLSSRTGRQISSSVPSRHTPKTPKLPPPSPKLSPQEAARLASTPHKVRERRILDGVPEDEINASGLTVTEQAAYDRQKARGDFVSAPGGEDAFTPAKWLERENQKRQRLRGLKPVSLSSSTQQSQLELHGVGQKVYLPNILFRMLPNKTPKGQPYNPYEATFRIPQSVTKQDVRSYLHTVYGVATTYIRTDNYFAPITRVLRGPKGRHHKTRLTYKRAVVGLVDPFYFPEMIEDMSAEDRAAREDYLNDTFQLNLNKQVMALAQAKSFGSDEGWKRSTGRLVGKKNLMRAGKERREKESRRVEEAIKQVMESSDAVLPSHIPVVDIDRRAS